MQPHCEHPRTKVIARRDNVDYVECLDCKKVFEAEDLEELPPVLADDEAESG